MLAEPPAGVPLYDAHNHLQDERLSPELEPIVAAARRENIRRMVVNGSSEEDWPAVLELARRFPQVIPSFGYHPWYIRQRSESWVQALIGFLEQIPSAVGEIGLDKWIKDHDLPEQEKVFLRQLEIAAERNLPVSIHCLQAWGRMLELLRFEKTHSIPKGRSRRGNACFRRNLCRTSWSSRSLLENARSMISTVVGSRRPPAAPVVMT